MTKTPVEHHLPFLSEHQHIRFWPNLSSADAGASVEAFLQRLGKPSALLIPGKNNQRVRAISTLLHGNEPSGIQALFQWLKHAHDPPATDILCLIGAVPAALTPPGFFYRHLPGKKDLNRCFWPEIIRETDHSEEEYAVAAGFVALLDHFRPECVIDIHNTSGKGPHFAVSVTADQANMEIASLFTRRMIVTDLRMGALMELSSARMPIVTIECGGSQQEASLEMARRGLHRYLYREHVFSTGRHDESPADLNFFETLHNPVRVELLPDRTIGYSHYKNSQDDITLVPTIEDNNFSTVTSNTPLGWMAQDVRHVLKAVNSRGENIVEHILEVREGQLYPARPIKMFMATTNAAIAQSDCLFYVVDTDGRELKPGP